MAMAAMAQTPKIGWLDGTGDIQDPFAITSAPSAPKVVGSRLHYKKRSGNGPAMGWVSILAGGKRLLEEASEHEPWRFWKGSPEEDLRDVFKNATPSGRGIASTSLRIFMDLSFDLSEDQFHLKHSSARSKASHAYDPWS